MSTWTNGGPSGSSGSEFVHVDGDRHAGASTSGAPDKSGNGKERDQKAKSSLSSQRGRNSNGSTSSSGSNSTNWQSIINRLTDQTMPEDQAAIRKLGEDVRKAGAGGAQAAVNALRTRMTDRNATPEIRMRSISVARVLAQRITSGVDAQRQIAAPPFVNALRSISSDPNVRASLKTWASQIRIGDPSDASELAPITGLDEHLASVSDAASQPARRPPANTPGTASFQGRPQLATTEEVDEDFREGLPIRNTNSSLFSAPIPGGFGLDGSTFDANSSVTGGPTGSVREFLPSSIQGIPPHLTIPQLGVGGVGGAHPVPVPAPGSGSAWGEDEDGVQSDAPSARSRHKAKSKSQAAQPPFGVIPSMDGGRDARSRLSHRTPRHERSGSTLSSSLIDGTLSEPESLHTPAQDPVVYARHHGTGIPVPGSMPGVAPQVMPQPHQRSTSPDPVRAPRHRSPSPVSATRSRMTSRVRAQSRRRPAPTAKDPAAMLIELTGVQFVRARQDYDALREDELSLNEGDVLAVIKREADGRYWLGHIQGQVGRFPVHVVEVLSHQARPQGDSTAQEEKTAELLRRAREIEDFMEHLHDFDITRQCITEDDDIQTDLASLLDLRREVVRHLDETTTGIGRLKAMLNQIKQAQRVHDRMIDSRIAGYAARTAIHDETPRMNYQDLPSNMGYQYAAPPFDMSPYTRRTGGPAPQQIEQAPARASITQRGYGDQRGYNDPAAALRYRQAQEMAYPPRVGPSGIVPPRTRTYSYAPASTPTTQRSPDDSIYATEPSTPGEPLTAGATNGQPTPSNGRFPFPVSAQHGATQNGVTWGDGERTGTVKDEVEHATRSGRTRGGSHNASETSARAHTSRRGAF